MNPGGANPSKKYRGKDEERNIFRKRKRIKRRRKRNKERRGGKERMEVAEITRWEGMKMVVEKKKKNNPRPGFLLTHGILDM